ncbi:MAG: ABC transporter substrate-binding protein [Spirochaetia bacterium]|nr:ABC transporter substrate-binding protein [Spirochaetia bacterium]
MRNRKMMFLSVVFCLVLLLPVFGGGQQEGTPGVSEDEIFIGSTQALSGPVASIGTPLAEGMQAYFAHVNKEGGIHGRKVNLQVADDQFDPSSTTTLTRRMVERDGVFAMVGSLGSPNVLAVMDYLNDRGVPFVYQGGGATELAVPPKEYVFPFQPNYLLEGNLMVNYLVEELGHKRLGVLYRAAEDGQDAYDSMMETIEMYPDAEIVEAISVESGDTDFSTAISRFESADVDGIMTVLFRPQSDQFLEQAYEFGLTKPTKLLTYANADQTLIDALGAEVMENVQSMAWVLADFDNPDFPPWQWYADYVGEEGAVPNAYGVAGMVAAEIFTEAARRAGEDLTREALVDALESMNGWDGYLALGVTYSEHDPEDTTCRLGKQSMYVMEVQKGEWFPVSEWIEYKDPN